MVEYPYMAVPKWHRSKSRQKQRRMHLFLKNPPLVTCAKCGKAVLPHTMCMNCGFYRAREIIDVFAKLTKKEEKQKKKELAAARHGSSGEKGLSPEELSKKA